MGVSFKTTGGGVSVGSGSGTANRVAKFTSSTAIEDTNLTATGTLLHVPTGLVTFGAGAAPDVALVRNSAGNIVVGGGAVGTTNLLMAGASGLLLRSGGVLNWSSTTDPTAASDTGIRRIAAGSVGVSDGSTGDGLLRVSGLGIGVAGVSGQIALGTTAGIISRAASEVTISDASTGFGRLNVGADAVVTDNLARQTTDYLLIGRGGTESPVNRSTIRWTGSGWAAPANVGADSNGDRLVFYNGISTKMAVGIDAALNNGLWLQSIPGAANVRAISFFTGQTASAVLSGSWGTVRGELNGWSAFTDTSNYEGWRLSTTAGTGLTLAAVTAGTGGDNLSITLTPAGAGNVAISTGQLLFSTDTGIRRDAAGSLSFSNGSTGHATGFGLGTTTPKTWLSFTENGSVLQVASANTARLSAVGGGTGQLDLVDTGATANQRWLNMFSDGGTFTVRRVSDDAATLVTYLSANLATDAVTLGSASVAGLTLNPGSGNVVVSANSLRVEGSGSIGVVNDAGGVAWGAASDLWAYRDAANTLAQRNGANAQTLRVYGTFTDASNYERAALSTVAGSGITLAAETAGTGGDNLGVTVQAAGTGAVTLTGGSGGSLRVTTIVAPAATGTRYLCIDTAGVVTSSASACSGT